MNAFIWRQTKNLVNFTLGEDSLNWRILCNLKEGRWAERNEMKEYIQTETTHTEWIFWWLFSEFIDQISSPVYTATEEPDVVIEYEHCRNWCYHQCQSYILPILVLFTDLPWHHWSFVKCLRFCTSHTPFKSMCALLFGGDNKWFDCHVD